jgi:hypothetical protein
MDEMKNFKLTSKIIIKLNKNWNFVAFLVGLCPLPLPAGNSPQNAHFTPMERHRRGEFPAGISPSPLSPRKIPRGEGEKIYILILNFFFEIF